MNKLNTLHTSETIASVFVLREATGRTGSEPKSVVMGSVPAEVRRTDVHRRESSHYTGDKDVHKSY